MTLNQRKRSCFVHCPDGCMSTFRIGVTFWRKAEGLGMTTTAHEEISLIFLLGVLLGQCPASLWDTKGCVRIMENSEGATLESLAAPSHSGVLPTEHNYNCFRNHREGSTHASLCCYWAVLITFPVAQQWQGGERLRGHLRGCCSEAVRGVCVCGIGPKDLMQKNLATIG